MFAKPFAVAVAVLVALGVGAGSAAAGTLTAEDFGEFTTIYTYTADAGERNDMRLDSLVEIDPEIPPYKMRILDLAGIDSQVSPLDCPGALLVFVCRMYPSGIPLDNDSLIVRTGDGKDKIRHEHDPIDLLLAGSGPCGGIIQPHPTCLRFTIDAGEGDDYIDIQDGVWGAGLISACGPGNDTVRRDPSDVVPADCENVFS
jgi:hypothetical protein